MGNIMQKEDNNGEFTCEICYNLEPNSDKRFRNGNKCSHPFCTDCVARYIAARLDDSGSGEIDCPGIGCGNSLVAEASAAVVGPALFARWCDALCEAAILRMESCYCPNPNCGAVIVNECGGVVRRSTCPSCKKLFCFECKRFWHAGFGCSEAPRERNDVAFGRLVEENKWMRCPRCRHFVELNEGCSVIPCRCGILFCYKCGHQVQEHWCGCEFTNFEPFSTLQCIMIALFVLFTCCLIMISIIVRLAKLLPLK